MPIFKDTGNNDQEESKGDDKSKDNQPKTITKTIILPDGSYGTETIYVDDPAKSKLLN